MLSAGALALLTPAGALADKEIVGSSGNRFDAATYTMDQGEKLTFRNVDPFVRHDVASVAPGEVKGHLFASDTIGQGTSFVEGSQYLTTGEYPFFCSIHEADMRAKLVVTSMGTPAQRPAQGSPPALDETSPVASIKGPSKLVASKLVKARKLVLTVGADEASELVVTVQHRLQADRGRQADAVVGRDAEARVATRQDGAPFDQAREEADRDGDGGRPEQQPGQRQVLEEAALMSTGLIVAIVVVFLVVDLWIVRKVLLRAMLNRRDAFGRGPARPAQETPAFAPDPLASEPFELDVDPAPTPTPVPEADTPTWSLGGGWSDGGDRY